MREIIVQPEACQRQATLKTDPKTPRYRLLCHDHLGFLKKEKQPTRLQNYSGDIIGSHYSGQREQVNVD